MLYRRPFYMPLDSRAELTIDAAFDALTIIMHVVFVDHSSYAVHQMTPDSLLSRQLKYSHTL